MAQGHASGTEQKVKDCEPQRPEREGQSIKGPDTAAYHFADGVAWKQGFPWSHVRKHLCLKGSNQGENKNCFREKTVSKKQGHKQQAQQVMENTCLSSFTGTGPSLSASKDKITTAYGMVHEFKKIDL